MLDVSTEKLLRSIFQTLAYADVFEYPLTADEVYRYLGAVDTSLDEVTEALGDTTLFSKIEDYYTLRNREELVETRKRRAEVARGLWSRAARYGWILAWLPFVRMVAVTGSLAMNNAEKGKDIDYMIVTAPNRLWTSRALCLLVGRFAKLQGLSLCPNYLVTTKALALDERSLYVAHEVAQMIPLSGLEIYQEFRRLNRWTADYLPNASSTPDLPLGIKPVETRSLIKKLLEFLLGLPIGDGFERWEMNRKMARLRREQSSSLESYFSSDVCKGHIDRHGEQLTLGLASRLENVQ